MRAHRMLLAAALAAIVLLPSTSCVLAPEIKDKIIELALGASHTAAFVSQGSVNNINETRTIDLAVDIDLPGLLDDAGVDISDVKDIRMSGAKYRVKRLDPTPDRRIVNGTVTAQRGTGPVTAIVTNFSEDVNSVTSFKTAPLDAAGVALINQILADLLTALKAGQQPTNMSITYTLTGQSTPSAPTDFEWELQLDVTIVGTVKVTVVQ